MPAFVCPIDHLNDELARRGLRVAYGDWPVGDLPTLYTEPVQPSLPGLAAPAPSGDIMPRPQSKLSITLANMLRMASARVGDVKSETLGRGLRVDVMVCPDGTTRLMIARRSIYPSDQEWSTILSHWPYDIPLNVEPEKFEYNQWRCMRSNWPTPEGG